MSRTKLQQLGIDLPAFPTTSVGSFPKPEYLVKARKDFAQGEISAGELEGAERRATQFWIRRQEDLGVDVLVDGEMYRGDMVAFFADRMAGLERGGLVRSYGNRYYHKPVIAGPIQWPGPMTVRWWEFAQSLTARPVKAILTGPYTMMDWSFDEHYPSRREASLALARELRNEVDALIEAGARIIQIDEPAISVRPEELPLAIAAMDVMTRGAGAYFITHICYGHFERIYPRMLDMPVDNFDLEMSHSTHEMLDLFGRRAFTKDISFGVVDVHTHLLETVEAAQARLRRAVEIMPEEAIWVDPDCGLKTRTTEESLAKMSVTVAAAGAFRTVMA